MIFLRAKLNFSNDSLLRELVTIICLKRNGPADLFALNANINHTGSAVNSFTSALAVKATFL
jgi:hypothetical protein